MKPVPLLDLKAQFAPLRDEIDEAIRRGRGGPGVRPGTEVRTVRRRTWPRYVGAEHAIGCASGTDALILSLAALGVGRATRS